MMDGLGEAPAKHTVRTRFLILSDTHGEEFSAEARPLEPVDVAIHCGDLSYKSNIRSFEAAIRLLEHIKAPLKLLIPGNHDFTLDDTVVSWLFQKIRRSRYEQDVDLGYFGESRDLFAEAERRDTGITLLFEGTHEFRLRNGARLKVFASPFTPTTRPRAFQYNPERGHNFDISEDTDVIITHGPPRAVLDRKADGVKAGCPDLFAAVARARPRLHCFGHVHESWGAKFVAWKQDTAGDWPSFHCSADHGSSFAVEDDGRTATLGPELCYTERKEEGNELHGRRTYCSTSHTAEDVWPVRKGKSTLFVNAALKRDGNEPLRKPWLVDIDLERADPFLASNSSDAERG